MEGRRRRKNRRKGAVDRNCLRKKKALQSQIKEHKEDDEIQEARAKQRTVKRLGNCRKKRATRRPRRNNKARSPTKVSRYTRYCRKKKKNLRQQIQEHKLDEEFVLAKRKQKQLNKLGNCRRRNKRRNNRGQNKRRKNRGQNKRRKNRGQNKNRKRKNGGRNRRRKTRFDGRCLRIKKVLLKQIREHKSLDEFAQAEKKTQRVKKLGRCLAKRKPKRKRSKAELYCLRKKRRIQKQIKDHQKFSEDKEARAKQRQVKKLGNCKPKRKRSRAELYCLRKKRRIQKEIKDHKKFGEHKDAGKKWRQVKKLGNCRPKKKSKYERYCLRKKRRMHAAIKDHKKFGEHKDAGIKWRKLKKLGNCKKQKKRTPKYDGNCLRKRGRLHKAMKKHKSLLEHGQANKRWNQVRKLGKCFTRAHQKKVRKQQYNSCIRSAKRIRAKKNKISKKQWQQKWRVYNRKCKKITQKKPKHNRKCLRTRSALWRQHHHYKKLEEYGTAHKKAKQAKKLGDCIIRRKKRPSKWDRKCVRSRNKLNKEIKAHRDLKQFSHAKKKIWRRNKLGKCLRKKTKKPKKKAKYRRDKRC